MKDTILVTGGAGYIGSHTLVEILEKTPYRVISIDNFSNSDESVYSRVSRITGKKFLSYTIDLCDKPACENIFREHEAQLLGIIHFAAFKSVGESVQKPLLYYRNNLLAQTNMLELAVDFGIRHFIFSSSCSVYGNIRDLPVSENSPLNAPESPYGLTKAIGEKILSDTCKAYPTLNGISLRYFNPTGAHPSGIIGELPRNKPENLVPVITQTAAGKIQEMTVHGNDYNTRDGTCIRDYIHVCDIAFAHVQAFQRLAEGKNNSTYSVYNLGSGTGVTVLEAIRAFEKVSGKKLDYRIGPKRPGDVEAIYSDCTKAGQELNWVPKHTIESMMESAWKWQQMLEKVPAK